jgi:hypothetical protein
MAIGLSLNAGTNTITVTGGTAGTPGTFHDMWVIDQASGWNSIQEIVLNGMYFVTSKLDIGNATAATYIASSGEAIYFDRGCFPSIGTNATFKLGGFDTSPTNPSWLKLWPTSAFYCIKLSATNANLYIYGSQCIIKQAAGETAGSMLLYGGSSYHWDATIQCPYAYTNASYDFGNYMAGAVLNNSKFYNVYQFLLDIPDASLSMIGNNIITGTNLGISHQYISDQTFSGVKFAGEANLYYVRARRTSASNTWIINPDIHMTSTKIMIDNAAGKIYEQYSVDFNVKDRNGNNLDGVTISIKDSGNNSVYNDMTVSDGTANTAIISYMEWSGTSEILRVLSPHSIICSKAGFRTKTIDNVSISGPLTFNIQMHDDSGSTIGSDIIISKCRSR